MMLFPAHAARQSISLNATTAEPADPLLPKTPGRKQFYAIVNFPWSPLHKISVRCLDRDAIVSLLAASELLRQEGSPNAEPFNADLKEACPGRADRTYCTFPGKHAVGNGTTTDLFVRIGRGWYHLKKISG
jgi:hypothetical protein